MTRTLGHKRGPLLLLGLFGSVLPDADLLYFYWIDHRRHFHHSYWTHLPVYWLAILLAGLVAAWLARSRAIGTAVAVLVANVLLHLVLDTIGGGIAWLYPLSPHRFVWVRVPAGHGFWLYNFILHWTFLLEIPIVAAAVLLAWRSRYSSAKSWSSIASSAAGSGACSGIPSAVKTSGPCSQV